jgi:hypothetical protein
MTLLLILFYYCHHYAVVSTSNNVTYKWFMLQNWFVADGAPSRLFAQGAIVPEVGPAPRYIRDHNQYVITFGKGTL